MSLDEMAGEVRVDRREREGHTNIQSPGALPEVRNRMETQPRR